MGVLKPFIFIVFVSFSLTACNVANDSEETTSRAIMQGSEQQKELEEAIELSRDLSSGGGQPGAINVSGGVVKAGTDESDALVSQILLDVSTGKGWKGTAPDVEKDVQLSASVSAERQEKIDDIEEGTYINMGCNPDDYAIVANKEEKAVEKINPEGADVSVASAEIILICDSSPLDGQVITMAAKKIVMKDSTIGIEGTGILSVLADSLVLEGKNLIKLEGKDGQSTAADGPSLELHVVEATGDGNLKIDSAGSNYVEKI